MLCAARKMYARKVCAGGDHVRMKISIQGQRLTFANLNLENVCVRCRALASHLDSLVWLCPTRVSGCCP